MVPYDADEALPHFDANVRTQYLLKRKAKRLLYRSTGIGTPQRPKAYADYEGFLRRDMRGWAEGFLFGERLRERGYFDPSFVKALWERHLAGNESWTMGKFASLITIDMALDSLQV
jgi:asparagine synthase (glutamine-hydrolysing)